MKNRTSATARRNDRIRDEHEAKLARGYDPAEPWSDYALDQAAWRISIGTGTQADKDALAHQRAEVSK